MGSMEKAIDTLYVPTKFRVVSDLHAGDGSPADDLMLNQYNIRSFAYNCEGVVVIGAGDILELKQTSLPKIKNQWGSSFDYYGKTFDWHYIRGNHDIDYPDGEYVYDELIVEHAGRRILITHGHQFDPMCRKNHPLLNAITKMAGLIEWVYPNIDNGWWGRCKFQRLAPLMTYIQQASLYAVKRQCDTIIFGHTHNVYCGIYNGITVVNSGCWVNGRSDFVEVSDGIITLESWNDRFHLAMV